MQISSGSYSATGSAVDITGPGWQADIVLVKGGTQRGVIWTRAMPAGSLKALSGSLVMQAADGITAHASGFSVAADNAGAATRINISGTTYYWIAIRDNGAGDCAVGSYTGNGGTQTFTSHAIGSLTAAPTIVWAIPGSTSTARAASFTTRTFTTGQYKVLTGAAGPSGITALVTGGFSVGASGNTNANTETYYYAALSDATGLVKTMSYTSIVAGGDDRVITGLGFDPQNVFVNVDNASYIAALRFKDQSGDVTTLLDTSAAPANVIQSFVTDGFTIGTNNSVNDQATARPYHVWAMRDGTSTGGGGGGSDTSERHIPRGLLRGLERGLS